MQTLGVPALATSSAALAWALGYGDGDRLPVELLTGCIKTITRRLSVPLTVDIEGGYSPDPKQVAVTVEAVIDAGAVGINIEDGRGSPSLLCQKIEAARTAAERSGIKLFINARTDVYLKSLVPPERFVEETISRAKLYASAGADGIFAAGARDAAEIAELVGSIDRPLNILALAGTPSASELRQLGVRRLSSGSGIAESVYGRIAELARGFIEDGLGDRFSRQAMPYRDINTMMIEE